MNRLGICFAGIAILITTGCGGSGNGDPRADKTTPALKLLTVTQACRQVQMVNDELHGPGRWPIPTYGKFGEETADLANESVPEIASALKSMSDQAVKVGGMSGAGDDVVNAADEWATQYQVVEDICARTDSPIGRLP